MDQQVTHHSEPRIHKGTDMLCAKAKGHIYFARCAGKCVLFQLSARGSGGQESGTELLCSTDDELDSGEGLPYTAKALKEITDEAITSMHGDKPMGPDVLP